METDYPIEWPQFFTASVIKKAKHLLNNDAYKNIIVDALRFAIKKKRINLIAFVIMSNHIHLVWQQIPPYTKEKVQLGFMKFKAQQIKFDLQKNDPELLNEFKVEKKDRQYQIWKRDPVSVELFTQKVFFQKIDYIHRNPLQLIFVNTLKIINIHQLHFMKKQSMNSDCLKTLINNNKLFIPDYGWLFMVSRW